MVHGFGRPRRRAPVVAGEGLNVAPKGQQPGFEIVLRRMWVKLTVVPDPCLHLPFCIGRIDEVTCPGVNVRQRDYRIPRILSIPQKPLDGSPKLAFLGNPSVTWEEMDLGHSMIEAAFQELQQMRFEGSLSPSLDYNGDLHALAPMRPLRQSSSSE